MPKDINLRPVGASLAVYLFVVVCALPGWAQTTAVKKKPTKEQVAEQLAEKNLAAARQNPLQLRHFLLGFPKGADLHYHLSGGVYAETFIRDGAEDGLCVNVKAAAFTKCPAEIAQEGDCPDRWKTDEIVPARAAFCQQHLYDALVDSFSMRGFVPYAGVTAHDHFFDAFAKFSGIKPTHKAEWVDEVASRAAAQNEQYMELMISPDYDKAAEFVKQVAWTEDFAKLQKAYQAPGFEQFVQNIVKDYQNTEKDRQQLEHCGQSDAAEACKVDVRYLVQVLRGKPKEIVFLQLLLAFEAVQSDPERVVGINFVQPEDGYIPVRDYKLHMRMVKYFHDAYPKVHIALHAGELTYGFVPPETLCCHVRLAVEAGAERIGHGADIMYEEWPHELMKEMAAQHVMVEINLSSNDVILGVSGKNHPLPLYRLFGVPVALSTDDEGVSRADMTNEYVRAVETYGLSYVELKKMVRTGLQHAFLPGESLWRSPDVFTQTVVDCTKDELGAGTPSKSCADYLHSNEKAAQQWELERRFRKFESEL
jgi:adenosine deaminase